MADFTQDYLLDKQIKILQPIDGYRASTDAVLLAAAINKIKKGDNILDLGSGTGAISLCLAERFKDIKPQITGVEIQQQLADLANKSANLNGYDFLHYINADIFNSGLPFCSFNHVISNPPYFEENMPTSPTKGKATAHNFCHIKLKDWIDLAIKMIKPQGYLYMVNRSEALDEILSAIYGRLGEIKIYPLYSKKGQKAKRVIVCARKDSKSSLAIEPPITLHNSDGSYTAKAESVLRLGNSL